MILDVRNPEQVLGDQPLMVWIILSLEIVVEYLNRRFLLVKYPYYAIQDRTNIIQEGHWYPPFVGFTAEIGTFPPQTVGDLITLTNRRLNNVDVIKELEQAAHALGLGSLMLEYRGTILEVKSSPTYGPGGCRAYRIERYGCRPRTDLFLRHITDPECLKGHAFLPLDDIEPRLPRTFSSAMTFVGKPLVSDLQAILEDSLELGLLRKAAIATSSDAWTRSEVGFLVLVDIAGFGNACKFAREHLSNMLESGSSLADRFRLSLAELFQETVLRAGIAQMQFTGDGFIAGLPDRMSPDDRRPSFIEDFLERYLELVQTLSRMNDLIEHTHTRIGSRLTIHHARFGYGRIGGPTSLGASLGGDDLVELVRCDAALSRFACEAPTSSCHSIAITGSALKRPGLSDIAMLKFGTRQTVQAVVKERSVEFEACFVEHS